MADKEKGFTLVELSIVLVIIGLLIGGILAAQSMISTSKIEAVAMQIGQFDAGVENFKIKYNYLPGDAPAFGGNGDDLIDSSPDSFPNQVNAFKCEHVNFWFDFDPNNYTYYTCGGGETFTTKAITSGPGKNSPLSKLGLSGSFFLVSGLGTGGLLADAMPPSNYYTVLAPSQIQVVTVWYSMSPTTSANSAVKPADLLALDKKIDDGIANTGNILSGSVTDAGNGSGVINKTPLTTCNDAVTHAYNVSNNTYECTPLIRIGASVGDPQ